MHVIAWHWIAQYYCKRQTDRQTPTESRIIQTYMLRLSLNWNTGIYYLKQLRNILIVNFSNRIFSSWLDSRLYPTLSFFCGIVQLHWLLRICIDCILFFQFDSSIAEALHTQIRNKVTLKVFICKIWNSYKHNCLLLLFN